MANGRKDDKWNFNNSRFIISSGIVMAFLGIEDLR